MHYECKIVLYLILFSLFLHYCCAESFVTLNRITMNIEASCEAQLISWFKS